MTTPPSPHRPLTRRRFVGATLAAGLGLGALGARALAQTPAPASAASRPAGPVRLRGIAWNHSRGFTPMVATGQRYGELHPDVEIVWEKRSLQAFADAPIHKLAETFDLLVIDHPFAGFAAQDRSVLDLNVHARPGLLADHAAHSAGPSHASYEFDGYRCALAIDGATPSSGWREDILAAHGQRPPQTWEELLELARGGFVAIAGIPVDCLMNFFMFCNAQGEEPCATRERIVGADAGIAALEMHRELTRLLPDDTWKRNPIRVWDALGHSTGRLAYCPFAYSYSNYARAGYAPHALRFGDLPQYRGRRLRPTLGGTGIAVSAHSPHRDLALDYAQFVASGECQRTLYFDNGGQPAHRGAWTDAEVNRRANNFFRDTLPAMDNSWTRPRYFGYMHLQDHGGDVVRDYLTGQHTAKAALDRLNEIYLHSLKLHA
ncbi:MAG: extracellular solute-binding protein [Opitutaceae bacterium]|nr:extracellular solute-binding protein [Opitutaceae bacterium]